MEANANPAIRELSAGEVEFVSGANQSLFGAINQGFGKVAWWIGVAGDYYFGGALGEGYLFHASPEQEAQQSQGWF